MTTRWNAAHATHTHTRSHLHTQTKHKTRFHTDKHPHSQTLHVFTHTQRIVANEILFK